MTLHAAFQFIVQLRHDATSFEKREALPPELTLDALAKQGEATGLLFTSDELRTAFKHDWAMRWQRYRPSPHIDPNR